MRANIIRSKKNTWDSLRDSLNTHIRTTLNKPNDYTLYNITLLLYGAIFGVEFTIFREEGTWMPYPLGNASHDLEKNTRKTNTTKNVKKNCP